MKTVPQWICYFWRDDPHYYKSSDVLKVKGIKLSITKIKIRTQALLCPLHLQHLPLGPTLGCNFLISF